jgi:hypothetical protein
MSLPPRLADFLSRRRFIGILLRAAVLPTGALLAATGVATAQPGFYPPPLPPPRPDRPFGHPPSRLHVWRPGHWRWTGRGYVWVPGQWVTRPPRRGWRHGYWVQRGGRWIWVEPGWY